MMMVRLAMERCRLRPVALFVLPILLCGAAAAGAGDGADGAPPDVGGVRLNGYTFRLPDGFTIELAAVPPLVVYPICADFDEQGRLYVAEASGADDDFPVQLRDRPHRILRLEDADGDGRFDRRTVFADRMMLPQGCMWHAGSLYVGAPPSIWKLTDTDGDGEADRREEWFRQQELGGCANGVRGPYLGPDGMIYWCKGGHAAETYERPGRPPLVTRANHIFRRRPDGGGFEHVMTGGMDNPVEVAFTRGGERLFTATQFQFAGQPRVDGIFHAVYGGVYPKDLASIFEHPWSGPTLLPALTHWGAAAPAGLTRYESQGFGADFQDDVFAALFNFHKVTRHRLEPDGSSFATRDEDFLACDSIDFHPTDVLEDADGSLLVIETGGWYRRCCPSSNFYSPEVRGAIYRIRREGSPRVADPRGLRLDWGGLSGDALAALLGDPRPAVRRRAMQSLADLGPEAVPALAGVVRSSESPDARLNAVWASARIDHASARAVARAALDDPEETVRQAALHAAGLRRDREAVPHVLAVLRGPSAQNRRAAAEALGRIGNEAAVPALLEAAGEPADRMLEHSLTFALIEIADRPGTSEGLGGARPGTRRAAMSALDQMPGGRLDPLVVGRELDSTDPAMKQTAWWIAARHPEWGAALAPAIREVIGHGELAPADREALVQLLAKYARDPGIQQWLGDQVLDRSAAPEVRRTILRAMAEADLEAIPAAWTAALSAYLATHDGRSIAEAARTVRAWRLGTEEAGPLPSLLLDIARDDRRPDEVRLTCLAAIPGGLDEVAPPLLDLMIRHLHADQPAWARTSALEALAAARLDTDQLVALSEALATAGFLERDRLLTCFERPSDDRVGRALVAALRAPSLRSGLRPERLDELFAWFGPSVRRDAEEIYAALEAESSGRREQIERLLPLAKEGDPHRGKDVFYSEKAACSSCHRMGFMGGNLGPALTEIGTIRTEEDLLESILFPSVTIVQGHESWNVQTGDGRVFAGVVLQDTPDAIVLGTRESQSVRLRRDEIDAMKPSETSIMPEGFGQLLTPQELADLTAFLKTNRW